jgi:hypothetical protein
LTPTGCFFSFRLDHCKLLTVGGFSMFAGWARKARKRNGAFVSTRAFLIFAGQDAEAASALTKALSNSGIIVRSAFDMDPGAEKSVLAWSERELEHADVAIVLWSKSSTDNGYVKRCAHVSLSLRTLISVVIEDCKLHAPFNALHAHLLNLTTEPELTQQSERLQQLLDAIEQLSALNGETELEPSEKPTGNDAKYDTLSQHIEKDTSISAAEAETNLVLPVRALAALPVSFFISRAFARIPNASRPDAAEEIPKGVMGAILEHSRQHQSDKPFGVSFTAAHAEISMKRLSPFRTTRPLNTELVEMSVFTPRKLMRSSPFRVQVFLHQRTQEDRLQAEDEAKAVDPRSVNQGRRSLEELLTRGEEVTLILSATEQETQRAFGLLAPRHGKIVWDGTAQSVSFVQYVEGYAELRAHKLVVEVLRMGIPVGALEFIVTVQGSEPQKSDEPGESPIAPLALIDLAHNIPELSKCFWIIAERDLEIVR